MVAGGAGRRRLRGRLVVPAVVEHLARVALEPVRMRVAVPRPLMASTGMRWVAMDTVFSSSFLAPATLFAVLIFSHY
jgi:hypothetical protein